MFYLELFNMPGVAVILPFNGESEKLFSHAIDVVEGKTVDISIDTNKLKSLEWKTTHPWENIQLGNFFALVKERVSNIMEFHQKKAHHLEIEEEIKKELGDIEGKTLSHAERKKIIDIITNSFMNRIIRNLKNTY